jgi:hypothetical protein
MTTQSNVMRKSVRKQKARGRVERILNWIAPHRTEITDRTGRTTIILSMTTRLTTGTNNCVHKPQV